MSKLKTFDEFNTFNSGDIDLFAKRVSILVDENIDTSKLNGSLFNMCFNPSQVVENGSPVLMWKSTNTSKIVPINEKDYGTVYMYNRNPLNIKGRFFSKFIGEDFIPKTIKNRNKVKSLNFPIVAIKSLKEGNSEDVFNTYNRFKGAESHYTMFQEKIIPKTRYRVTLFKNDPISIKEDINGELYNTDINKSMTDSIKSISSKISEKYPLDVFSMNLYESTKGSLYVKGIKSNHDLDKKELNELYIRLYEDYYETSLPIWFKNKVKEA